VARILPLRQILTLVKRDQTTKQGQRPQRQLQIDSCYKATARTSDAIQSHVRFESTQMPESPAVVLLSVTKLPWSPQIDATYELVAAPKR
jgi:hypothetical protein